jgi:hypothetical protein
MPNSLLLEIIVLALLVVVVVHAAFLHLRISRLRRALTDASQVLPSLDAAVARMGDAAGGFARRVQTDLESLDMRIANARRLATELGVASRTAEDMMSGLDRQIRQNRRLEGARAAAIPRELVEPKGFAERLNAAAAAPAEAVQASIPLAVTQRAAAHPAADGPVEPLVRVNMI